MRRAIDYARIALVASIALGLQPLLSRADEREANLQTLMKSRDLIVLGDVQHGVAARVDFFSSERLFASMAGGGVTHVAIEMPRVLGRQAMGIDTAEDVDLFTNDVVASGVWHFTDPEHPGEESEQTQRRVASAMGRQVLLAKRYGLKPIFYDFNNPLGGFSTYNDPVYRCLAELSSAAWVRYGLDTRISKDERDAAIMRERFSHDDELAAFIESETAGAAASAKLVVIPGYAHAVLAGGLADALEQRFGRQATIIAVFASEAEAREFPKFLGEQAQLLQIDLSRPPHYSYDIAGDRLTRETGPERFAALKAAPRVPPACYQIAQHDTAGRPMAGR